MKITDCEVIESVFKKDRWYVRFDIPFNGAKLIPKAVYIWLCGNPCFESVPKDYVIHHLDHDKLNDDITNLVLMYKHHHISYHWKYKQANPEKIQPAIKIERALKNSDRKFFFPIQKPKYHKTTDRDTYHVSFTERINNKSKQVKLYSYLGTPLKTENQAQDAVEKIWAMVSN